MPCNICHEEYRGLAGDCACTMYGYRDEAEFREEANAEEIRGYERAQRIRKWDDLMAPKFVRMSENGRPVYRFGWHYLLWKYRRSVLCVIFAAIAIFAMSGCAGGLQQVDDAFGLPMADYARKWEGGLSHWTIDDIHIDANRVVEDKYYDPKRPELNGYCWETAEMKHDMALESGYDASDMEIIVILIHPDTAMVRDVDEGSTHAVLRVGDTIYDNGFLSRTPFDASELGWYGQKIPNTWSTKEYL